MKAAATLAFSVLVAACSPSSAEVETVRGSAVEHGRALFEDPKASPSASNTFACATCHRGERAVSRLDPGAPLGGVTSRTSYWGGQRVDLLEAIDDCRTFFMDAPRPWTPDDEDARAMYAYLAQLPPALAATNDAVPFTLVTPADLPAGDPQRGAGAFDLACKGCHGELHSGAGRLATFIPALPDDVVRSHASLSPPERRLVFVTKVRRGAFGGRGSMPPFSREVLSDDDLAGVLAWFALY